jgi:serine/threonine-protein kinase
MPKPGELPSYPSESTEPRVEPTQGNRPPSGAHPIRPPSGSHPSAAASLHQIGEIVGNRYRLNRMLGHGALTETWEATHIALQRSVAIKFLRQLAVGIGDKMIEEARAIAQIHHPNVVEFTDFGRVDAGPGASAAAAGDPYFVTELLTGQTVAQLIARRGTVAWSRAVNIAQQVCSALAAAHYYGIVHRDLRPGNVFLVDTGQGGDFIKVVDFGLARGTTIGGTPAYMSPEQCQNEPLDPRSDVYALGCLLYTMITGDPPFVGDPDTLRWRQITEAPRPLREKAPRQFIPDELEALVARCLEKSPARRYADTRELAAELATLGSFAAATSVTGGIIQNASGSGPRPMGFAGRAAPRNAEELTNSYKPVNQPIVDDDDPDEALAAAYPAGARARAAAPPAAPVVGLSVGAVVGIVLATLFVAGLAGLGVWWLVTTLITPETPAAVEQPQVPEATERGEAKPPSGEPSTPPPESKPPTPKIPASPETEAEPEAPAPTSAKSKPAKRSQDVAPEPEPQPEPQPEPEKKKPSTKPDSKANEGIDHEELLDPWDD